MIPPGRRIVWNGAVRNFGTITGAAREVPVGGVAARSRVRAGARRGPGDSGVPDEALLGAMGSGDHDAAAVLVTRHQRRIYGIAYAITGDRRAAEDVTQEAFLRIWRHAAGFDPSRSAAPAWMARIARNLSIDYVRARRVHPVDPGAPLLMDDRVSELDALERQVVSRDDVARLRHVLAALPVEQRRALVLASFYGYTASEIAESDGVPLGTVKGRIRLGLQKVREAVRADERGADGGEH